MDESCISDPKSEISDWTGPDRATLYSHMMPRFLPDGRHFLFFAVGPPMPQHAAHLPEARLLRGVMGVQLDDACDPAHGRYPAPTIRPADANSLETKQYSVFTMARLTRPNLSYRNRVDRNPVDGCARTAALSERDVTL